MKIRLSQSKCGSTVDQVFLQALHFLCARGRLVVVAAQVKEAMRDVETQLAFKRCAKHSRLSPRRFHADHDLAMLERDDVRGTALIKEATMKLCNPTVGHEGNAHFAQLRENVWLSRWKFQAFLQHVLRETLKGLQLNRDRSLPAPNRYRRHARRISFHVNGRDSAWKFRVINRAPLLNVK
jgi:hypothetical protein